MTMNEENHSNALAKREALECSVVKLVFLLLRGAQRWINIIRFGGGKNKGAGIATILD